MKNEQPSKPLDQDSFAAIAGAFSRLASLSGKSIDAGPSDNTQAEKEALIEFLATQFLAHAGEFIAAWQLCNTEYLPALSALRKIAMRAGFISPPSVKPAEPTNPSRN